MSDQAFYSSELESLPSRFDDFPISLYRLSPDDRWLEINTEMVRLCGYPNRTALLAAGLDTLFLNAEQRQAWLKLIAESDVVRDIEMQLQRHDGTAIWVNASNRTVKDENGSILWYEGSLQDISAYKEKEQRLINGEKRYRTMIEQSPISMQIYSPDGYLREANQAFDDLFSVSSINMIGIYNILDDEAVKQSIMDYLEKMATGEPLTDVETEYDAAAGMAETGRKRWLRSKAYPVIDAFGMPEYFVLIHEDITELKQYQLYLENIIQEREAELKQAYEDAEKTQQELAESEKMAALGQLVAGIAHEINTPLGAINSSVGSIAEAVPLTLEQIPETFEFLSTAERQEFMDILYIAQKSDSVLSMREKRNLRKILAVTLADANVPDADNYADSLINMGIYNFQEDVKILLLHPQNKLIFEALNNFSSLIRGVKNIQTATQKVGKIVFALKNFARYDNSAEQIAFDIRDGLDTVLTLYYHQIKQGTELVRDFDDVAPIQCYPDELNQVWTNLVNNALHAMDYKGRLTIQVKTLADSAELMVAVSDTGHGMTDEVKKKIFQPFFTTKRAGEGSGLGLDIVKKIIDKHNGRIEVESEVGQGTTFRIFLPMS